MTLPIEMLLRACGYFPLRTGTNNLWTKWYRLDFLLLNNYDNFPPNFPLVHVQLTSTFKPSVLGYASRKSFNKNYQISKSWPWSLISLISHFKKKYWSRFMNLNYVIQIYNHMIWNIHILSSFYTDKWKRKLMKILFLTCDRHNKTAGLNRRETFPTPSWYLTILSNLECWNVI